MDTYTPLLPLKDNPNYQLQKKKSLRELASSTVDPPLVELIVDLNQLPFCFTLQSCHGHFIFNGQEYTSLADLQARPNVTYRIAYIAFCLENSDAGRKFFTACKEIAATHPESLQFCCAKWFCKRQHNSYVLQVEPERFKEHDYCTLDYSEAMMVENMRNTFYLTLAELSKNLQRHPY